MVNKMATTSNPNRRKLTHSSDQMRKEMEKKRQDSALSN